MNEVSFNRFTILVVWAVLVSVSFSSAQEQFGNAFSNYSPTSAVFHNPANSTDSEVMIEINLGSLGGFLHSDYAYLPASDFNFFRDALINSQIPNAVFNSARDEYSMYSYVEYHNPSISYQYKDQAFGLFSRLRYFGEASDVPEIFANILEVPQIKGEDPQSYLLLNRDLTMKDVNVSLLSFAEIGVNYSKAINHFDRNLLIVGVTLKYLAGIAGGGLHIDQMDYRIDTSGVFSYSNFSAKAAKSLEPFSGAGFSGDVGFVYKRMLDNVTSYNPFRKEAGCRIYDYKWKVGISLVDLGYVKFKDGATNTTVDGARGSLTDITAFQFSEDPEEFLINTFAVDSSYTQAGTSFSVVLPAAIILQYDYSFENKYFVAVEFIQGVTPKSTFGVKRPQIFTFIPRYENRFFELGLPMGMYNLREVRMGLYLRLGPLTVGTDKLGTYLSVTDVTGFDAYAKLSWRIIHPRSCGRKRVW